VSDPRNPDGPDHPFGRPRPNGRNGAPNGRHADGPHGVPNRPIPFPAGGRQGLSRGDVEDDLADEPLDLVAVQADDELINALSAGMAVSAPGRGGYTADDKVVAMLAAWKAEVDREPIPELVDVDTAVAAIESGSPKRASNRRRHLIPLAGAAALIVFSIAGVSIGAQHASPGDALFPVTQVLYKDAANSKVAAVEVQQRLQRVNEKLAGGDSAGAQQDLVAMAPLLEQIRPEEGKTYLASEQTFLAQKAVETPQGQPVDPQAPLKNGTPRPTPPKDSTEGKPDPSQTTTQPSSSTSPSPSSPTRGTTDPKSQDPKVLVAPDGSPSPSPATSSSPATKPPVTEGGKDPATPTTTTVPPGTTATSMGTTSSQASTSGATTTPS
jgi:hypothetical protein